VSFRKQRRPTGGLGRIIRAIRRRLDLNQSEFAAHLGWPNETLCVYELGRIIPSIPRLVDLLRIAMTDEERGAILATLERKGLSASGLAFIASQAGVLLSSSSEQAESEVAVAGPVPEIAAGVTP
jgi:transcriptional regulator with XRE-family HTH domain